MTFYFIYDKYLQRGKIIIFNMLFFSKSVNFYFDTYIKKKLDYYKNILEWDKHYNKE
jgi:hypothetical protein